MTQVTNTPISINGTLAKTICISVLCNRSFAKAFEKNGLECVRDQDLSTIKPEYELFKAGYMIEGFMLPRNVVNYAQMPPSRFKLSLSKNDYHVMDFDFHQGSAYLIDPVTRKSINCYGRPNNNKKQAIARAVPSTPTLATVLSCLHSDASTVQDATFDEWCDDLGYSSDSLKADQIYKTCQKALSKLRPYMEELGTILEDF